MSINISSKCFLTQQKPLKFEIYRRKDKESNKSRRPRRIRNPRFLFRREIYSLLITK